MNKQNTLIIVISVALSLLGSYLFLRPTFQPGAALNPQTTRTNPEYFQQGITTGGSSFSTSTYSTIGTVTAASLVQNGTYVMTPGITDVTLTLPASSTLTALVPKAGDMKRIYFVNATSTAGIDVIFASGAGTYLITATGTSATFSGIGPNRGAFIEFWRTSTTTSGQQGDIVAKLLP